MAAQTQAAALPLRVHPVLLSVCEACRNAPHGLLPTPKLLLGMQPSVPFRSFPNTWVSADQDPGPPRF